MGTRRDLGGGALPLDLEGDWGSGLGAWTGVGRQLSARDARSPRAFNRAVAAIGHWDRRGLERLGLGGGPGASGRHLGIVGPFAAGPQEVC